MSKTGEFYYSISAQKRIKWYSFQAYAVGMYRHLEAKILGEDVSSVNTNVYFNLNQEIYLPKDFKIQLWCGRGSPFKDGPQLYSARSAIHISINKAFLDKKLNVMIGMFDVLYKDFNWVTTTFSKQSSYYFSKDDTRRVRITINYRFGKMQIQQKLGTGDEVIQKSGK